MKNMYNIPAPFSQSTFFSKIEKAIKEQNKLNDEFLIQHLEKALNQRGFQFKSRQAVVEFAKAHLKKAEYNRGNGISITYIYLGYVDSTNPGNKIMTIMNETALDYTNFHAKNKITVQTHQ